MRRRYAYTYGDYLMLEAEAPHMRHEFIDGEKFAPAMTAAIGPRERT